MSEIRADRRTSGRGLRVYYVNPLDLVGEDSWNEIFEHAAALDFNVVLSAPIFERHPKAGVFSFPSFDRIEPLLGLGTDPEQVLPKLTKAASAHGIGLMLDVAPPGDRNEFLAMDRPLDPRFSPSKVRVERNAGIDVSVWQNFFSTLTTSGIIGLRLLGLEYLDINASLTIIEAAQSRQAQTVFHCFVYTPGTDFAFREILAGSGIHGVFSSLSWWDMREGWLLDEFRLQAKIGQQIAFPEAPFQRRLAHGADSTEVRRRRCLRALALSADLGDGLLVPMGFEFGAVLPLDPTTGRTGGLRSLRHDGAFDLEAEVRAVNQGLSDRALRKSLLLGLSERATVLVHADKEDLRVADDVKLTLINRDLRQSAESPAEMLRHIASPYALADAAAGTDALLPGEVRSVAMIKPLHIVANCAPLINDATARPRLAIENVQPVVDQGRFPIKRVVGDRILVTADILADGHDQLTAALFWRAVDDQQWQETPLTLIENDRWQGAFDVVRVGRYEFYVEAWKSKFSIYKYELTKKHEAQLDLSLELIEGEALVRDALATGRDLSEGSSADLARLLNDVVRADREGKVELFKSSRLGQLMAKADRRSFLVRSSIYVVESERREAAFASWYQIFPRSQSGDPMRHGTFDDVIQRLPAIREMGFDVLYFPPIHPIGQSNRKGRNNALVASPDDPGSPYAIGSAEGGHDAIHPELGGFEAFRRLVQATKATGLELALDLAIQASPDHPWLKEHPGWFEWRPDGSIRYAENPPKKYEDIVNVDFYATDAIPELWITLRDIVQLWIDEGVLLFRVDNPHTKPFPFWEWLIADIRMRHPEVVFLSEAFTRPKVMYHLAKVGFSQSYTYFTWRNTKWELEQYMSEITRTDVREYFRPHFFVNTHDINPDFLQDAPRPAYLIRAALAATLSGLWGVYNGFELCEGRPDVKRKEYADSEKYEIRAWDYDRPGNIKREIALLNRIRRDNPALHSHLGLELLSSSNPNVMFFEKADPGRDNILLVAVCLNSSQLEESRVEIPLWHFGQDDNGTLSFEDLVTGSRFSLTGKHQTIRLDPAHLPFAIWRIRIGDI